MNEFLLSIVIPIYNGEKYIKRCIESLINQQNFNDIEIILVNDGSTDSTETIITDYSKHYPENIYVFSVPNRGVSAARNIGLDKARGNYVTFVDADDWVEPNCYTNILKNTMNEVDIICTGFCVDFGNSTKINYSICSQPQNLNSSFAMKEFLIGDIDVHIWTKIFKRELIANIRFNFDIKIAEDRIFTCECLALSENVIKLPYIYYHYYQNESSAMHEKFSDKRLDDLKASEKINKIVSLYAPSLLPYAECMDIYTKCRIVGEIYCSGHMESFLNIYNDLLKEVRSFGFRKSIKYSSFKHWMSLILCKIHPGLYSYFRNRKSLRYSKG